jgi:hypothetical protein
MCLLCVHLLFIIIMRMVYVPWSQRGSGVDEQIVWPEISHSQHRIYVLSSSATIYEEYVYV